MEHSYPLLECYPGWLTYIWWIGCSRSDGSVTSVIKTEAFKLGTLCLPETGWHVVRPFGYSVPGPCSGELRSLGISHWGTEACQEMHRWACESLLFPPTLDRRLMRDPWAHVTKISCSQVPDLEKLWENKCFLSSIILGQFVTQQ